MAAIICQSVIGPVETLRRKALGRRSGEHRWAAAERTRARAASHRISTEYDEDDGDPEDDEKGVAHANCFAAASARPRGDRAAMLENPP